MTSSDPRHIPEWLTNAEDVAPCPCGYPMHVDEVILYEGETELQMWVHVSCIPSVPQIQEHFEDDDEI